MTNKEILQGGRSSPHQRVTVVGSGAGPVTEKASYTRLNVFLSLGPWMQHYWTNVRTNAGLILVFMI